MTSARPIVPGQDFQTAPCGLYLPAVHIPATRPVAIDLFAGAGGFSLGLHHAGWHVAAAVEIDKHAAATYLCNLGSPDTRLHRLIDREWTDERAGDVLPDPPGSGWIAARGAPRREDYPNDYLYEISQPPAADKPGLRAVLPRRHPSPDRAADSGRPRPAGRRGQRHRRRPAMSRLLHGRFAQCHGPAQQVFEFCRLVLEVNPKTFVMENVPGLLSMVTGEGVPVIDAIALYLSRGGYADYQALRRALAFDPTARAGVRAAASPRSTGASAAEDDEGAQAEQPDLFGADT
jgi:DNA (cytosine-5)-methyltransferase 1